MVLGGCIRGFSGLGFGIFVSAFIDVCLPGFREWFGVKWLHKGLLYMAQA